MLIQSLQQLKDEFEAGLEEAKARAGEAAAAEPSAGIFAETANSLEESVVNHHHQSEEQLRDEDDETTKDLKNLTLTPRRTHSSGSDEFEDAKETLPPKGELCDVFLRILQLRM